MCYVMQKAAPGRGGVDGQEEDEAQVDEERRSEEGHQDGECQAPDREGREEAAQAGCEDIPSGARGPQDRRVAGKHGPAPRLVAVSLLELIPNRITRARPHRRTLIFSLDGERQAILTPSSKAWYPAPEQRVANNAKRQASEESGGQTSRFPPDEEGPPQGFRTQSNVSGMVGPIPTTSMSLTWIAVSEWLSTPTSLHLWVVNRSLCAVRATMRLHLA